MITFTTVRRRLRREFRQLASAHADSTSLNPRLARCYSGSAIERNNTVQAKELEGQRMSHIDKWKAEARSRLRQRRTRRLTRVQFHLFDEVNNQSRVIAMSLVAEARLRIERIDANPFLSIAGREHLIHQVGKLYSELSDRLHAYLDKSHLELLDDLAGPRGPQTAMRSSATPWEEFSFPKRL